MNYLENCEFFRETQIMSGNTKYLQLAICLELGEYKDSSNMSTSVLTKLGNKLIIRHAPLMTREKTHLLFEHGLYL